MNQILSDANLLGLIFRYNYPELYVLSSVSKLFRNVVIKMNLGNRIIYGMYINQYGSHGLASKIIPSPGELIFIFRNTGQGYLMNHVENTYQSNRILYLDALFEYYALAENWLSCIQVIDKLRFRPIEDIDDTYQSLFIKYSKDYRKIITSDFDKLSKHMIQLIELGYLKQLFTSDNDLFTKNFPDNEILRDSLLIIELSRIILLNNYNDVSNAIAVWENLNMLIKCVEINLQIEKKLQYNINTYRAVILRDDIEIYKYIHEHMQKHYVMSKHDVNLIKKMIIIQDAVKIFKYLLPKEIKNRDVWYIHEDYFPLIASAPKIWKYLADIYHETPDIINISLELMSKNIHSYHIIDSDLRKTIDHMKHLKIPYYLYKIDPIFKNKLLYHLQRYMNHNMCGDEYADNYFKFVLRKLKPELLV